MNLSKKRDVKRLVIVSICITLIFSLIMYLVLNMQNKKDIYTKNKQIAAIVGSLEEISPDVKTKIVKELSNLDDNNVKRR